MIISLIYTWFSRKQAGSGSPAYFSCPLVFLHRLYNVPILLMVSRVWTACVVAFGWHVWSGTGGWDEMAGWFVVVLGTEESALLQREEGMIR